MMARPAWPPVFVRCDGGKGDGMGHISRCLTLALALQEAGAKVTFLTWSPDGIGRDFIERNGFVAVSAQGPAGTGNDLKGVIRTLRLAADHPVLILDSRDFDSKYADPFNGIATVVCLDDDLKRDLRCIILINNNPWIDDADYTDQAGRTLLIGTRFNLVRADYFERAPRPDGRLHVLITMGGEDPFDQTSRILKCLRFILEGCNVTVVVGPAHPAPRAVAASAAEVAPHAKICVAPSSLTSLMRAANVAITAGGTTCYELAAAGVAQAAIILDDHQAPLVGALEANGCLLRIGRYDQVSDDEIVGTCGSMMAAPKLLRALGVAGTRLFDAPGAPRIVEAIQRALVAS